MAPLDVLTAESELATDQQNLIVAQTTKLTQETVLLNDIAKSLLAKDVAGIEIVPTTPITIPDVVENIPLQDAVQEAWRKRPELYQADMNLENSRIEAKARRREWSVVASEWQRNMGEFPLPNLERGRCRMSPNARNGGKNRRQSQSNEP